MEKRTAIIVGSFDPPTLGHQDLIKRAAALCDRLIVGVATTRSKGDLFSAEERVSLLKQILLSDISVEPFSGLATEFAREKGAHFLIRGLRGTADLPYEQAMAESNRLLSGVETLFLLTSPQHLHISSSLLREVGRSGGPLDTFVPPEIKAPIQERLQE